jgi:hypothetical protein
MPHFVRHDSVAGVGYGGGKKGGSAALFTPTHIIKKACVIPMRPPAGGEEARDPGIGIFNFQRGDLRIDWPIHHINMVVAYPDKFF